MKNNQEIREQIKDKEFLLYFYRLLLSTGAMVSFGSVILALDHEEHLLKFLIATVLGYAVAHHSDVKIQKIKSELDNLHQKNR